MKCKCSDPKLDILNQRLICCNKTYEKIHEECSKETIKRLKWNDALLEFNMYDYVPMQLIVQHINKLR